MLFTARDFFRGLSRNQISKRAKFEFLIGSSRKLSTYGQVTGLTKPDPIRPIVFDYQTAHLTL